MTTVAIVVLAAATVALAIGLFRQRRRFAPLEKLIEDMERVDLSRPGSSLPRSIDGVGETEEVERIELAFLRMMRRLEAERRRAGSAATSSRTTSASMCSWRAVSRPRMASVSASTTCGRVGS